MKQNLTTVVEHTVKAQLEKMALDKGMPLSKFVRFVLEKYIDGQQPNKLRGVVTQTEMPKKRWKEITNLDGTVDLVEDKNA
jgi:hypothetical protein